MNDSCKSCKVIAISNRKGGAGKTTVTVNLAVELGHLGYKVLLIDLDSQGHCAVGLGLTVAADAAKAHDIFRVAARPLRDAIQVSGFANLSVALADQLHEHGSGNQAGNVLATALQADNILAGFDVVLIDTPPSLDSLLINALTAADAVVVPFIPHKLSMEGVKQLIRFLFRLKSTDNPDLSILGFVPVMVANHIRHHRLITGEMAQRFGAPRILPGIRNDIRVAEAFSAGKPLRHFAARSRASEDFSVLAGHVAAALR